MRNHLLVEEGLTKRQVNEKEEDEECPVQNSIRVKL